MTTQEWLSFATTIIKSLIWAAALVVAARLVLVPILANRGFRLKGKGIDLTVAAAEQKQSDPQPPDRPALPAANPLPQPSREAIRLIEEAVARDLQAIPPGNREAVLIRAFSTARVVGRHAATYNVIFGSQIAGLKRLDEIGTVTVDEARRFFHPYEKAFPDVYKNYTFDGWLGYMISAGLVVREGDRLRASPFGHDFLVWLRESRLSEAKAG